MQLTVALFAAILASASIPPASAPVLEWEVVSRRPHDTGAFTQGLQFDDQGRAVPQPLAYPGSNLFSLASGGALFVRDPHHTLVEEQLNGGEFAELTDADWHLIRPYLEKNEEYFGISIEKDLLTVDGCLRPPREVYRKVRAVKLDVLAKHDDTE